MSQCAKGRTARKPSLKEARNGSLGIEGDPEGLEDRPKRWVGKGVRRCNGWRGPGEG